MSHHYLFVVGYGFWLAEGIKKAIQHATFQSRCEREDVSLLKHLNVTYVDSCSLILDSTPGQRPSHLVSKGAEDCEHSMSAAAFVANAATAKSGRDFEGVIQKMFPYSAKMKLADPLHPTTAYSELQVSRRHV